MILGLLYFTLVCRSNALVLVHKMHALSPKSNVSVNVMANGARYRFYVNIGVVKVEGGYVFATDGYKYEQGSILWEVKIPDGGDVGVTLNEGEESGNNQLKSLQWQTPITNSAVTVFWALKDPNPANQGTGTLSATQSTTDNTGLATVTLTCSSKRGDDHIVTGKGKSADIGCDSGKAVVWKILFYKKGTAEQISDTNVGTDGNVNTEYAGETSEFDVAVYPTIPTDITLYFSVSNSQVEITPTSSEQSTKTVTVTGKGDGTSDSTFMVTDTPSGVSIADLLIKIHKPKRFVYDDCWDVIPFPNGDLYGDYEARRYLVYDVQLRVFNILGYYTSEDITMVENDDGIGGHYPSPTPTAGPHSYEHFQDHVWFTWTSGTLEEGHRYKWNQRLKIFNIGNIENNLWRHNGRKIDSTHLEIDSEAGQY